MIQHVFISVLKNGAQCFCFEEIPVRDLIKNDAICTSLCHGSRGDTYACGGTNSYSVYVSSKYRALKELNFYSLSVHLLKLVFLDGQGLETIATRGWKKQKMTFSAMQTSV